MTIRAPERLIDQPNCLKLFDDICIGFSYLFREHKAKIVYVDEHEMFDGCSLIVSFEAMNILFSRERGGGIELLVGPHSAISPNLLDIWQSIDTILDFLDNRYPRYKGPDFVDERMITSGALEASLEKVYVFYSRDYGARQKEFLAWHSKAHEIFMQSINESDARGQGPSK